MRLLYVCDALAICGGLERVLIEKANWLAKHVDYKVCLLTANQGDNPVSFPLLPEVLFEDLDIRFYKQYHMPYWKRFVKNRQLHHLFRERMSKKIQEFAPDIIICTRLDFIHDIVCVKGTIPLVLESHSSRLAGHFEGDGFFRRIHILYLQLAVKKVDMVVALTNGDAVEWRKLTPKVCVIPNAAHLNESGSYTDCTAKSIIYVGRFSKQKDVGTLLCIWNLIHQRHPDWCLHFYGGYGEKKDSLLTEIQQMNANIIVHQPTINMIKWYLGNSILVLTSRYEPFGLVLPEAMSCGLPVVAFDCPYGPAEIITDNMDGFLIKERNISEFADKVCMLIENPTYCKKIGMNGIHSSQRYKVSVIMPKWDALFKQLIFKS